MRLALRIGLDAAIAKNLAALGFGPVPRAARRR